MYDFYEIIGNLKTEHLILRNYCQKFLGIIKEKFDYEFFYMSLPFRKMNYLQIESFDI